MNDPTPRKVIYDEDSMMLKYAEGALGVGEKTVPLVVYDGGIRHVVGEATVDLETGEMVAQIPADISARLTDVASLTIAGNLGMSFSLQPPEAAIIPLEDKPEK